MAVMPTLAWEPGDPLTPYHLHSFIRLDHILTPDTATPYHDHCQPRHLPHVIVGGVDLLRRRRWYMYVDLLRGTVVEVSSFETKTGPLPEAELYFWLDMMAVFDNAEDSEYYNVTLLEHATPTAFTTHLNPVFDDPTSVTTTPSSRLLHHPACGLVHHSIS